MPSTFALLFALAGTLPTAQETAATSAAGASGPLARVIVLGSDLSDGFGLEQKSEAGVRTTLADIAEAALLAEHAPVRGQTSARMAVNTAANGRQLVGNARDRNPTLIVALDFLFWYGHGAQGSDAARMSLFEQGLAQLESFPCPIVVGDLPDLGAALGGQSPVLGGRPALTREQLPSAKAREELNERLQAWAADRPNVVVVPLSTLYVDALAGREITVRGNRWPAGSKAVLLQPDWAHTTLRGSIAAWIVALDRLVLAHPEIDAKSFEWDAETIRQKVWNAKEKDRKAQAERDARLQEKRTPPPEPPPPDPAEVQRKQRGERGGG